MINETIRESLREFDSEWQRRVAVVGILRDAIAYGIPFEYGMDAGERTFGVTVYGEWNRETNRSELDIAATQARLRQIVRWALSRGYKVEKKYSDSTFRILVRIGEEYSDVLEFTASRQIVCERKVIGTRVIPERVVEDVEWDCNKVSFSVKVPE